MIERKNLAVFQVAVILVTVMAAWQVSERIEESSQSGSLVVVDSNDRTHKFSSAPERVVLTNTYAASVMRMLDIDNSVIVGVSGDFNDEQLWPELSKLSLIHI